MSVMDSSKHIRRTILSNLPIASVPTRRLGVTTSNSRKSSGAAIIGSAPKS
jgi:hypothetical protein